MGIGDEDDVVVAHAFFGKKGMLQILEQSWSWWCLLWPLVAYILTCRNIPNLHNCSLWCGSVQLAFGLCWWWTHSLPPWCPWWLLSPLQPLLLASHSSLCLTHCSRKVRSSHHLSSACTSMLSCVNWLAMLFSSSSIHFPCWWDALYWWDVFKGLGSK